MKTTLYCYSATGNSLVIARAIATALSDTEIVPIGRFRATPARPTTERVGIIFPIIAWGPPRTVHEFVRAIDLSGVRYTFAIASCGGTAAGTLPRIRKALRKNGGDLHAGFLVRSASYMEMGSGKQAKMIEMVRRFSGKLPGTAEERLSDIIEAVRNERRSRPERNALLGSILGNFFHGKAAPQFAGLDRAYKVGENCASCGTCTRICPRGNVRLENGRPAWHHDCDFCGACITWCPQRAIGMAGAPAGAPHRHNPEIKAADLVVA